MKMWTLLETKGCYFPFTAAAEEVQISTRCTDRVAGHKTTACFTIHTNTDTNIYTNTDTNSDTNTETNTETNTVTKMYSNTNTNMDTNDALGLKPLSELTLVH